MEDEFFFFFEYETKHKVTRRRRRNYEQKEIEFQEAQNHFDLCRDVASWNKMFMLINLAVFNNMNKHLEFKLDKEVIEERSMDITINIMNTLKRKIAKGKQWKIEKVSSYVYLPCLARYKEQWQFEDKLLGEEAYCDEDDEGNLIPRELTTDMYEVGQGLWNPYRTSSSTTPKEFEYIFREY